MIAVGMILGTVAWSAHAGDKVGGGGNAAEIRINDIRADILKWIDAGGYQDLKLPPGLTSEDYVAGMKKVLAPQAVVVVAITPEQEATTTDGELKVVVDGQPKTCRGFVSRKDGLPHILCSTKGFSDTTEADQYRLIHHEYAGLADIEHNVGAASDYEISAQLTDFLQLQPVLKLAIKRALPVLDFSLSPNAKGSDGRPIEMSYLDSIAYCSSIGAKLPTARQLALYATTRGAQIRETAFPGVSVHEKAVKREIHAMGAIGFEPIYRDALHGGDGVDFYYNADAWIRDPSLPIGSHEERQVYSLRQTDRASEMEGIYFLNEAFGNLMNSRDGGGQPFGIRGTRCVIPLAPSPTVIAPSLTDFTRNGDENPSQSSYLNLVNPSLPSYVLSGIMPASPVLSVSRDLLTWTPERDQDGAVSYLNRDEAVERCKSKGKTLPKPREFAEFAVKNGAELRESACPVLNEDTECIRIEVLQMQADGFIPVAEMKSELESIVQFYYKKSAYKRPEAALADPSIQETYWARAHRCVVLVDRGDNQLECAISAPWTFSANTGELGFEHEYSEKLPVMCK